MERNVHRSKAFGAEDEMQSIERLTKKFEMVGMNLFGWTKPLVARVWITVLVFLR